MKSEFSIIKPIVLIALLCFSACAYQIDDERRMLQGVWEFEQVYNSAEDTVTETHNDEFRFSQDYSFSYGFSSTGESYTGSWQLGRDNSIQLIYHQQKDRNRLIMVDYDIVELTDHRLVLENPEGVVYELVKRH